MMPAAYNVLLSKLLALPGLTGDFQLHKHQEIPQTPVFRLLKSIFFLSLAEAQRVHSSRPLTQRVIPVFITSSPTLNTYPSSHRRFDHPRADLPAPRDHSLRLRASARVVFFFDSNDANQPCEERASAGFVWFGLFSLHRWNEEKVEIWFRVLWKGWCQEWSMRSAWV
jgi:hypothetical protein